MSLRQILVHVLGDKCVLCGSTDNLELHHKDRNPANNDIKNIQLLCRKCHNQIHKKTIRNRDKKKYITLPDDVLEWIDAQMDVRRFSSLSHALEYCVYQQIQREKEK